MALRIVASCVNCTACQSVCPSGAISETKPHFVIDASRCGECDGEYADPQCASICPVEAAIVDSCGVALNPPGSLTGISPERLRQLHAVTSAFEPIRG